MHIFTHSQTWALYACIHICICIYVYANVYVHLSDYIGEKKYGRGVLKENMKPHDLSNVYLSML